MKFLTCFLVSVCIVTLLGGLFLGLMYFLTWLGDLIGEWIILVIIFLMVVLPLTVLLY
jgi:hypothetical protein